MVAMSKANTIASLLIGPISLTRIAASEEHRDQILKAAKEAVCAILGRASLQETELRMSEPLLATHEKFTTD